MPGMGAVTHLRIATLAIAELQADEIRTIVGNKKHPVWVFTHYERAPSKCSV
jgi:hypothetical protein